MHRNSGEVRFRFQGGKVGKSHVRKGLVLLIEVEKAFPPVELLAVSAVRGGFPSCSHFLDQSGSFTALIAVQIYSVFGYTLGCILVFFFLVCVYKFLWESGQEESVCICTRMA